MGPETLADLDPRPQAPPQPPTPEHGPMPQLTRGLLGIAALCGVAAGVMMLLLMPGRTTVVALAYLASGLLAAACTRLGAAQLGRALALVLTLQAASLLVGSVQLGWGLAAPALPLLGLGVCVLCVAAGWRAGALLALFSTLGVLALAALEPATALSAGEPGTAIRLGILLSAIAAGLAGGALVSRVVAGALGAAHEREQRFRSLLGLAADAYWEIDHHYRLVSAAQHHQSPGGLRAADGLGAVPWDLPQFACDAETLDALQADLGSRVPFRDLAVSWTLPKGERRIYMVSGEPRHDSRGAFLGYWGVARDVTDMVSARQALAATETRYQELFSRIPTPLVLHRGGRVLDANPAGVALFGHADLNSMVGTDMLPAYESGDSRERARRRIERLEEEPLGFTLPVADYRLRVQGRQVSVRATGVRVDYDHGGPAMLAIFVDDTERLAVEEAVRRSEALLSHLVATSPDLITLTDMASGRFAMVNQTFERVTGWASAQAVGCTATELGLWGSAQVLDDFLDTLRDQGAVTNLQVAFVTRAGVQVPMLVSAARFVMDRRDYMVINARDLSQSERARLEREAILNNASVGIAVTRDRHFVLANPHFEQIFGWPPGALVGQPGRVVWPSDEVYEEVGRTAAQALSRGESVEFERQAQRRDGSSFLARLRARAIDPERPSEGGTAWIAEDVTERREFERTLARARDDAEAANRAKSAFLANTSHELRTPLNGMIGLARLAAMPDMGEERRRQYLDQIADSAQALAGIIADILDLSKIEAGKLQVERVPFDLGELLQTLQQTYQALAGAHGLTLHFDVGPDVAGLVIGDPLRLRQIVSNFLNNALKFTPQGHVHVQARRGSGEAAARVRFEVRDTGLGIDAATRARLFTPFTQADQSTTRRYGGTGLGLSICRELALLMGGEVGVQSALGAGSTFWAELPLPAAPAPAPAAQVTADTPMPVLPADAANAAATVQKLVGARVLMVEDNPVNMMIAVAMLERWGVTVAQAEDGREAVAAVQQAAAAGQPFDAVLMDVQMPVMSGHEATRALRGMPAGQHLPIIALTAAAMVDERDEALRSGMNDFLSKPIDAAKLRNTLLRWCADAPVAGD
ncbi:MAG: PAS domain S-box protein [Rubrivivax sp.]|jgi:PAS domain S-box-containing protein|nr:PAS domain S-box protein [Rubrivivax sp.]